MPTPEMRLREVVRALRAWQAATRAFNETATEAPEFFEKAEDAAVATDRLRQLNLDGLDI